MTMKVLVLGAAGVTGRHIVEQGIARGHEITAFVRDAAQSRTFPNQVHAIVGDALDQEAVERGVAGEDAVVYALGSKKTGPTTLFSDSTRLMIQAMEKQKVKRLVCITGVGTAETRGHGGFVYDRIIFPLFTKKVYEDKDRQESLIRSSSLDWIIVRPATFRDGAAQGQLLAFTDLEGVTLRRIARREVA